MACIVTELKDVIKTFISKNEERRSHINATVAVLESLEQEIAGNVVNIHTSDDNDFQALSNLIAGPVKVNGVEHMTIEHAFQYAKAVHLGDMTTAEAIKKAERGDKARALGRKAKWYRGGLPMSTWDLKSKDVLKNIMERYYAQSEDGRDLLLSTGDKAITHNAVGWTDKSKYTKIFPKLLLEIRARLVKAGYKASDEVRTGFKLTSRVKWTPKDQLKADIANAYVGFPVKKGSSSTKTYLTDARKAGVLTNDRIEANKDTIAYVSVNGGSRANEPDYEENLKKTADAITRILEAGGTVLMDTKAHANYGHNAAGEGRILRELAESGMDIKIEEVISDTVKVDGKPVGYSKITMKRTPDEVVPKKERITTGEFVKEYLLDTRDSRHSASNEAKRVFKEKYTELSGKTNMPTAKVLERIASGFGVVPADTRSYIYEAAQYTMSAMEENVPGMEGQFDKEVHVTEYNKTAEEDANRLGEC